MKTLFTTLLIIFLYTYLVNMVIKWDKQTPYSQKDMDQALMNQQYQSGATLERYMNQCELKWGVAIYPVIKYSEFRHEVVLRCMQIDYVTENSSGATELKMNPTFGLPLEVK